MFQAISHHMQTREAMIHIFHHKASDHLFVWLSRLCIIILPHGLEMRPDIFCPIYDCHKFVHSLGRYANDNYKVCWEKKVSF